MVDRDRIITGEKVAVGDILIGLPSNGLHTNGYSLARKLLFEVAGYTAETYVNEIKGKVGNELMKQHKSYWPVVRKLVDAEAVAAMARKPRCRAPTRRGPRRTVAGVMPSVSSRLSRPNGHRLNAGSSFPGKPLHQGLSERRFSVSSTGSFPNKGLSSSERRRLVIGHPLCDALPYVGTGK